MSATPILITELNLTYNAQTVEFAAIHEIVTLTSDAGPLAADVWVEFRSPMGNCKIPQEAEGFDQLFEVFKKFAGFNYEAFIAAMSSTENRTFICWQRM